MSAVDQPTTTDQVPEAAPASRSRARFARRALAVIVALAVVGVLAIGWLADGFGVVAPTSAQGPRSQQIGLAQVTLRLDTPSQAGGAALLLRVTDATGQPVVGAQVACALSMTGMGMALPTVRAQPTATPGDYRCAAPGLMPGAWTLALSLTPPGGGTGHTTFQFVVA